MKFDELSNQVIGVLGYIFACTFGVEAKLMCDAIILHGTNAQEARAAEKKLFK